MILRYECPEEHCHQDQLAHVDRGDYDTVVEDRTGVLKPFCQVHHKVMSFEVVV